MYWFPTAERRVLIQLFRSAGSRLHGKLVSRVRNFQKWKVRSRVASDWDPDWEFSNWELDGGYWSLGSGMEWNVPLSGSWLWDGMFMLFPPLPPRPKMSAKILRVSDPKNSPRISVWGERKVAGCRQMRTLVLRRVVKLRVRSMLFDSGGAWEINT